MRTTAVANRRSPFMIRSSFPGARSARSARGLLFVLTACTAACAGQSGDNAPSGDDENGEIEATASALAADGTSVAPLAAYSVALKLRTAYAGAALRVRRAANNVESDVGFT